LLQVLATDPGFRTEHVVTMDLELPAAVENSQKVPRAQFLSELMGRLRRIPGVVEVGGSNRMPLAVEFSADGTYAVLNSQQISPKAQDLISRSAMGSLDSPELLKEMTVFFDEIFRDPSHTGGANYAVVSEGFFRALRIPLLDGRLFDERDGFDAPQVALISSSLAQERWPKGGALGQTIEFGNMDGDLRLLTVIGIVGDIREASVETPPRPTIYVNYRQRPQATRDFTLLLQTDADALSVMRAAREDLSELDPDIPPHFSTMPQIFSAALETRRFSLTLVCIFAGTALFLAVAGIYGVTSYAVSQRTREFGVRMALGASPGAVLRLVVKQGIGAIVIGVLVGIGGSLVLAQTMKSLLFGVSPADPLTLSGVVVLLTAVSLVASYLPARKATGVDPMVALRYE
jgi:predicted permease